MSSSSSSQLPLTNHTPKPSPVTPAPSQDPLSKDQWRTLWAFADAVVPAIHTGDPSTALANLVLDSADYGVAFNQIEQFTLEGKHPNLARNYLEEKPSENPLFRSNIYRLLALYVPKDLFAQLTLGLTLLNYRLTGVFLTRSLSLFADQSVQARQEVIWSWSQSPIPIIRLLFKSLTLMVKQTYAKSSTLLHQVLSFPRIPVHGTPVKGFEYSFIEIPPGPAPEVIEVDAVIVGSGCGGSVVAKSLANAGYSVVVADKAYHWPAEHLPMTESEGFVHMFHNGGFLFSDDSSTCVLAGQAWGGGGTINWSASLQTQDYVRREWANDGLSFFTSNDFQDCLDTVCDRMGAGTEHIEHNKNNQVLIEGARRLGMTAKAVPQNTGGKRHYCGYCTMGCGSCEKQGPAVSYLPDAANKGAKFIEGLDVDKVIFRTDKTTGRKVASGIIGTWTSRDEHGGVSGTRTTRQVIIKAKRVVISAGTMHTPTILQRSKLKNKHIGKNLKLHPVVCIGGIYDEDIRPWEGGILTAVVSSLENQDGRGHGAKLEACTMLPATWLPSTSWRSGLDWKLLAPKFKNMTGHISLARDITSGSVYIDPHDGRPRYSYNPNKQDRQHIMEGMVALAKINYISGAREIFCAQPNVPQFIRTEVTTTSGKDEIESAGVNDAAFNEWLKKMRKNGLPDPDTTFLSAHQMGSCRMGATAKKGAIDHFGRTWEADHLYVADASTFPSASGVNPMVTNMAISEWIGRNLVKDLKRDGLTMGKM